VIRTLERAADLLLVALFLLIFGLVLAQIVFRYVLNDPLVWSEELARLAFIWVAMLAWSLGSRRRSHIAVTVFVDALPPGPRLALRLLIQASIIVFCLLLLMHGWTLTARNLDLPMVTIDLPYAAVYAVAPLGAAIVVLYALAEMRRLVTAHAAGEETVP